MDLDRSLYALDSALLDETIASNDHEAEDFVGFDNELSFSPPGITLSNSEGINVLAAFRPGSAEVADVGFVAFAAPIGADAAAGNTFAFLLSVAATSGIILAGTGAILVGRLQLRRKTRKS